MSPDLINWAPVFVHITKGDTISAIFVEFPQQTKFADAVDEYSDVLGIPAFAHGSLSQTTWTSALWQDREIFLRVDSVGLEGTSHVCLGVFDVQLIGRQE